MIMTAQLSFFPEIQPFNRGRLQVSALHELYYEECGNPAGKPAIVLHGGPGGGISPFLRRMHDPAQYRIILFDQRGCGNSTPHACLEENTTQDLVADMEKLRLHLNVERWQVVGGSWGSTLALAYAQAHVGCVTELIMRGIFTVQEREIRWFYQEGASYLFPEAWEEFLRPIPESERHDLVKAYYKRLTGDDEVEKIICARAWSQWEGSTLSLLPDASRVAKFGDEHFALAFGRIESHYFVNKGFFKTDGHLLANAHLLKDIPGVIVQGRYDVVTPAETAYALSKAWPTARFEIILDAGHTATEPGITDAMVRATNSFVDVQ
jgi:proline iminopeptidase